MNFAWYVLFPGAEAAFLLDGVSKFCYDSSCVNSKFIQIFLHVSEKKDDNQQICGKNSLQIKSQAEINELWKFIQVERKTRK